MANSENYKMYTLSQEVSFFGNTNELLTKEEWLIHMINSCYKKDIARMRRIPQVRVESDLGNVAYECRVFC